MEFQIRFWNRLMFDELSQICIIVNSLLSYALQNLLKWVDSSALS